MTSNDRSYINGIKNIMLEVAPAYLWPPKTCKDFYHIICNKAGLNQSDKITHKAFNELCKQRGEIT